MDINKSTKAITQTFTLTATDGYPLQATRYETSRQAIGTIIVAGATGVPQRFYSRFSEYACEQGFKIITFDYRGVAQSQRELPKDLDMSMLDWARKDLAAAIDVAHEEDLPLFLVGHSFGGQAIGLLPNHHILDAAYSFGAGAGWAGWMSTTEALKARFMWNAVFPALVKWQGYMAWSKLGMGEDMPYGVYRDWKKWCSKPNYFFGDKTLPGLDDQFSEVRIPYTAATSSDDAWAPELSRDALCKHYTNCELSLPVIRPGDNQSIGHMGYFRNECAYLWDEMLQWFAEQTAHTNQANSECA